MSESGIPVWVEEVEGFAVDMAFAVVGFGGSDEAEGSELGEGSGDAVAADVELLLEFFFVGYPADWAVTEEAVEGFGVGG